VRGFFLETNMNSLCSEYKNILGDNDFVFLDIGARGGPQKELKELLNNGIIKIILVEFEEKEASKLKQEKYIVCDKAVWSESTNKKIYSTKNKSRSSLLKPNNKVLEGSFYYDRNFFEIEKVFSIKTTTVKELINNFRNHIKQIDFIKIDIQGAEGHLFQSFDKIIWDDLIGFETELNTTEVYEGSFNIGKLMSEFYSQNFEIYDSKKKSSMTMTSYIGKNIFSKDYFEARPNSRFYKGKDLIYDVLFFKKINKILKEKNIIKIRKFIFLMTFYGYFDFAFFILLKSEKLEIIDNENFFSIKKSIKKIINLKLPLLWRIKEKFLLKKYELKKL